MPGMRYDNNCILLNKHALHSQVQVHPDNLAESPLWP